MILGKRKYYTIIAVKSFRFSRKSQLLNRKVTAVKNTIRQNQENGTRPWNKDIRRVMKEIICILQEQNPIKVQPWLDAECYKKRRETLKSLYSERHLSQKNLHASGGSVGDVRYS
jgi:hypothetical protein